MKKKAYKIIIVAVFPLVDFCLIVLAVVFSYKIYRFLGIGKQVYYEEFYMISLALSASLLTVLTLFIFGAYKKESSVLNAEEIRNVVEGLSFSFLIFMVVLVFGKFNLSRYVIFFSYVISMVLVIIEKTVFYHLLPLIKNVKGFNKRILIYGAGELGQALFRAIANSPKLDILPVGCIDDDPEKINKVCQSSSYHSALSSVSVLGTSRDIERIVKDYNIDEVVVAISNISREDFMKILHKLERKDINIGFVPNLYEMFLHRVNISRIGDIPIIRKADGIQTIYPYIKRCMDVFLSILSLIIFSPVFLIVAASIKMDSEGPVFFKQRRVGMHGKEYYLYKFRSMTAESDPYAVNPLDMNDSRITRVGRFLRKTSLDELPQIINVLKGEMSFVGPRPEMPFIVDTYEEIHRERLKVLPGITGLWQLSGDRKRAIHENMDYDLYYIRNMSFFLDVAILLETCIFAFRGI
jgi:exopolysaccharide biosynthesis polyprenyl glycosylphosphotransferase